MILRKIAASIFVISAFAISTVAQDSSATVERTVVFGDMSASYIGVETREVTKDNFAQFGLSEVRGVIVESVMENSPASKSGLVKGDVILRFDGEPVTSVRRLQRLVSEVAPDQTANLTISRNGSEIQLAVVVGRREQTIFRDGSIRLDGFPEIRLPNLPGIDLQIPRAGQGETRTYSFRSGGRQIGVSVSPLTKQLSNYFGVTSGTGLLISEVRDDSPAAKAGLRAGDVIVSADGVVLKENLDLVRAINRNREGEVTLSIVRDKKQSTVTISPEEVRSGEPIMDRFLLEAPISALPASKPFLKLRTPEEPIVYRFHNVN